jgi:hypothetical protein
MIGPISLGALLAATAPPAAPPPDRQQIEAAAARCSLPAKFLRVGRDSYGDYADLSPNGNLDGLKPEALLCMVSWAERTGARIGFISEPPPGPQTIARGPIESIKRAARAARDCGLPVHIDPLSPEEAVLDARSDAPSGPLECTRSWIEKQGDLRLGPMREEAGQ